MDNSRNTEGVGKKIVDALKMEETPTFTTDNQQLVENYSDKETTENEFIPEKNEFNEVEQHVDGVDLTYMEDDNFINNQPVDNIIVENDSNNLTYEKINSAFEESVKPFISSDFNDMEIPTNVAILKQLITKLPAGVTKQTGALIIKQTMEALGISMHGVLQEAQQVQENLNSSTRECHASIVEHKKQITFLEQQAQKYQRQYATLNDVISLFVQTSI